MKDPMFQKHFQDVNNLSLSSHDVEQDQVIASFFMMTATLKHQQEHGSFVLHMESKIFPFLTEAKINGDLRNALKQLSGKARAKAMFSLPSAKRLFFKRDVLENIESKAAQLIDARSHRRFAGLENEIQGRSTGHIPFSSNLPFTMLFNEDGTYKSLDKLQEAFNQIGSEKDKPIITTCGSGVTACVLLFALHLIGYENTMLYDGSWLDWSLDEETPKVRFSV